MGREVHYVYPEAGGRTGHEANDDMRHYRSVRDEQGRLHDVAPLDNLHVETIQLFQILNDIEARHVPGEYGDRFCDDVQAQHALATCPLLVRQGLLRKAREGLQGTYNPRGALIKERKTLFAEWQDTPAGVRSSDYWTCRHPRCGNSQPLNWDVCRYCGSRDK